jgi:hypothetical protein
MREYSTNRHAVNVRLDRQKWARPLPAATPHDRLVAFCREAGIYWSPPSGLDPTHMSFLRRVRHSPLGIGIKRLEV